MKSPKRLYFLLAILLFAFAAIICWYLPVFSKTFRDPNSAQPIYSLRLPLKTITQKTFVAYNGLTIGDVGNDNSFVLSITYFAKGSGVQEDLVINDCHDFLNTDSGLLQKNGDVITGTIAGKPSCSFEQDKIDRYGDVTYVLLSPQHAGVLEITSNNQSPDPDEIARVISNLRIK